MPIRIAWDDDAETILRWDFEGAWDWDMVYTATQQSILMRRSSVSGADVSVILNMEQAAPLQTGALTHTRNALKLNPEGRDLVVIVGRSAYLQTLIVIFRNMNLALGEQVFSADTLDQARALIRERKAAGNA
jgi:hypothetical protein